MIRYIIVLIWFYLILEFIAQFILSYTYIELGKRTGQLEQKVKELQIENGYLEDKVASSSSLLNAEQLGNSWGFSIPRKDQVIKLN